MSAALEGRTHRAWEHFRLSDPMTPWTIGGALADIVILKTISYLIMIAVGLGIPSLDLFSFNTFVIAVLAFSRRALAQVRWAHHPQEGHYGVEVLHETFKSLALWFACGLALCAILTLF